MKNFMVYVNSKFMVKVEAESNLEAEHIILELEGCDTALAFNLEDKDECSTETFRACMIASEFIGMTELVNMSKELTNAMDCVDTLNCEKDALMREIEEIDAQIYELQARRGSIVKTWSDLNTGKFIEALERQGKAHQKLCSNLR